MTRFLDTGVVSKAKDALEFLNDLLIGPIEYSIFGRVTSLGIDSSECTATSERESNGNSVSAGRVEPSMSSDITQAIR
jgi:hypothetical protein